MWSFLLRTKIICLSAQATQLFENLFRILESKMQHVLSDPLKNRCDLDQTQISVPCRKYQYIKIINNGLLGLDFICITTSDLPAMMCPWWTIRFTLCTYCPFIFILKQSKKKHQALYLKKKCAKSTARRKSTVLCLSIKLFRTKKSLSSV